MKTSQKIFVAGHNGLVGSALMRCLKAKGYTKLVVRERSELDLCNESAVNGFFAAEKPDHVFLAAAKVGGIQANQDNPAEFISQNLAIAHNVIRAAYEHKVQRLLFLGSSCIYPRLCPQPIQENALLSGPLEPTNRPYAVAKIAGIELCWAYNRQYGTRYMAAMPTNLFGPNDTYDLQTSHVLPALIRKMHEAKTNGTTSVSIWGTGTPRREFLYSDDLANGCIYLMEQDHTSLAPLFNENEPPLLNIGFGKDITIAELAALVAGVVGFQGELVFDTSHADGTPQKCMDSSRMQALGWQPTVSLRHGIELAYADFLANHLTS